MRIICGGWIKGKGPGPLAMLPGDPPVTTEEESSTALGELSLFDINLESSISS